ncbi:MAG: post-transcriptional regulator [Erysipelotrichaceae bacterium]|nr:post-transcriptional regulator [Erysipelotrichaceae bacterium]MDD3924355.1 post-transcriptional regulator [Erysipelotrichaceae bacterium]MDD4642944.1 post-transcriptional regulator [Erysipelotrichaceae bacterium]
MFEFDIKQLQLTVHLKLKQLQREQLSTLTYQNIIDTLFDSVWKDDYPRSLFEAVNDIMNLTADKIVAYLSKKAIIESRQHCLDDYDDLLQG